MRDPLFPVSRAIDPHPAAPYTAGLSERVAQAVEHVTFNHGVEGSSPSALTKENQVLRAIYEIFQNRVCLHRVCKPIAALQAAGPSQ